MFKKIIFLLFYQFMILLLVNLLISCASSNHNRRGSLSDAMEKASDDSEDREVETEPDPEPEEYYEDEEEDLIGYYTEEDTLTPYDEFQASSIDDSDFASSPAWFSIQGGTGIIKGKNYFGITDNNLALGIDPVPQNRIAFNIGFALVPLQQTSALKQSLDGGVTLLNLGFNYNYYTTPEHTIMGQYFTFGFKYNYMMWSYKNPILADYYDDWGNYEGTEEISNDGLSGFEFYSGVGFHILQIKAFQIGGEVTPGVIFWVWETSEGFENDVFSTFWYVKFKVLINFRLN
jgi:hypothetical protein